MKLLRLFPVFILSITVSASSGLDRETAIPDPVTVQHWGTDGCTFTFQVAEPEFMMIGDRGYPSVPGMPLGGEPGEPLLPSETIFIPVPPDCEITVDYRGEGEQRVEFSAPLLTVPIVAGTGLSTRYLQVPDTLPVPHSPIEVSVMRLTGTTVAAVTVSPFARSEDGSIPERFNISLSWPDAGGSRPMESHLLRALCPDGLPVWSHRPEAADSPFWGLPWARIDISSTGIYVLTGQELENAGCQVTGAPSQSLRLFSGPGIQFQMDVPEDSHQLEEIPFEVLDGGDGVFDSSDTLKFFAQGLSRFQVSQGSLERLHHRYAEKNVYWLTWGGSQGLRMDTVGALPDGSPAWGDSLQYHIWQEQDYFWVAAQEMQTGWTWVPALQEPSRILLLLHSICGQHGFSSGIRCSGLPEQWSSQNPI